MTIIWTNKKKAAVIITPIIATVVTLMALGGAANATTFTVNVPLPCYRQGDTINVSIVCTPTRPVKAWEIIELSFTKNVINAKSVNEGNLLKPYQTFFNAGNIDNTSGIIKNMYDLVIGKGNITKNGACVNITFMAIKYGQCYINLTTVGVTNETAYFSLTTVNASFFVYSLYDMNGDKKVDLTDLIDVAIHYRQTGAPGWIKEDINRNGKIDLLDLIYVAIHWGPY